MDAEQQQLVLHASPNNKNAFKSLIVADYLNIPLKETPEFVLGVSNWTPEFLAMNPLGKVPVLETPDGAIFESNAIARHVCRIKEANNTLYGASSLEKSQVDQWLDFAACELDANIGRWLYARYGYRVYSPEEEALGLKNLQRALKALEAHLSGQKGPYFLVGRRITLADIVVVCTLAVAYRLQGFTTEFMAAYPLVHSYFTTLLEQQPSINKYLSAFVKGEGELPPPSSVR